MFGKKEQPTEDSAATPASAKPELWGDIYTMPNTYQAPSRQGGGSGKRALVIILIVLLLAIVGLVVYLILRSSSEGPSQTTAPPTTTAPTPTPTPEPSPTPAPELVTAAERDRARYKDVREIQAALELYYAENNRYPLAPLSMVLGMSSSNSLSAAGFSGSSQGAVYLEKVPANPEPGGTPYLYESVDGTTYSLKFRLEQGTAGLDSGDHEATPLGIDEKAPVVEQPLSPRPVTPPLPTVDADSDGLTDAEEDIFGTASDKPDSDGDGYTDGSEVSSGYDPAAGEGALLAQSSQFRAYNSVKFYYQLLYPSAWEVEAVDTEGSEVLVSGGGSEFMEVLVVSNPDKLTAVAWYAKQFPSLKAAEVPTLKVGDYTWAMSTDGLNAYLATEKNIIALSYNIGTAERASYYQLFRAILNLFKLAEGERSLPIPEMNGSAGTM